jgi:tetratricopeptide (TPR) repeat protein
LPRYLIEILSDPPLPQDSTTRRILLLCLTSAFDAVRKDLAFHAPFTQEMLTQISADLVGIDRKQDQTLAEIADLKALLLAQAQRDQPQLYAQHTEMLIGLARNYATGPVTDFASAYSNLENALRVYDDMRRDNALPHNAAGHLDAVLARVQALNEAAQFDQARDELVLAEALAQSRMTAALDKIKEETSGLNRIYDRMIAQAALQNAPADAANALQKRLALDNPADPFDALRALWREWYERYRSHGVPFDGQVAAALARATLARAGNDTQRGAAQNDLGIILQILGQRRGDADMLGQAVDAYRAALRVYGEGETPQDWAATQNNLGGALQILGQRVGDADMLGQAVDAYRAALRVYSEEETRQDWAMTQNNLGGALQILGQRRGDADMLGQAVEAYRAALRVRSEGDTPQEWAATQNNLGIVLEILGQRWGDADMLGQAVDAYRAALRVYSEAETPQNWATTQNNLGGVLEILGQRGGDVDMLGQAVDAYRAALRMRSESDMPQNWAETMANWAILDLAFLQVTGDMAHIAAAREKALAARAVFARIGADWNLQKVDRLLADIDGFLAAIARQT